MHSECKWVNRFDSCGFELIENWQVKMAFRVQKISFSLVLGILIISDAICANSEEIIENSVGGG